MVFFIDKILKKRKRWKNSTRQCLNSVKFKALLSFFFDPIQQSDKNFASVNNGTQSRFEHRVALDQLQAQNTKCEEKVNSQAHVPLSQDCVYFQNQMHIYLFHWDKRWLLYCGWPVGIRWTKPISYWRWRNNAQSLRLDTNVPLWRRLAWRHVSFQNSQVSFQVLFVSRSIWFERKSLFKRSKQLKVLNII